MNSNLAILNANLANWLGWQILPKGFAVNGPLMSKQLQLQADNSIFSCFQ